MITVAYYENFQLIELKFDKPMVTIGNNPQADVKLFDPSVDMQHAAVTFVGNAYYLQVFTQQKETSVNGQPASGMVPISGEVQLSVGNVPIKVTTQPVATAGFGAGFGGANAAQFNQPGFGAPSTGGAPTASFNMPPSANAQSDLFANNQPHDPDDPNRITSWDEIAEAAKEDAEPVEKQVSIGAQMNQAKKEEKTNPILFVVLAIALAYLGYLFLFEDTDANAKQAKAVTFDDLPPIVWADVDIECEPPTDCVDRAKRAIKFANELYDKKDVQVSFVFESYKNYERAIKFTEAANQEPLADVTASKEKFDELRGELDIEFKKLRARYNDAEKRQMFRAMADVLAETQGRFPYKGAREHRWAETMKEAMVRKDIYPRNR